MHRIMRAGLLVLVAGGLLSGCCNSLMCQAKQIAANQLACDQPLRVKNITDRSDKRDARILAVSGCGKQTRVWCLPTNVKNQEKKYREDVIVPQNRLDLNWRCEEQRSIAHK